MEHDDVRAIDDMTEISEGELQNTVMRNLNDTIKILDFYNEYLDMNGRANKKL